MKDEKWAKINELFHDALDVEVDERLRFIQENSNDDAEISAEVLKLVSAHEQSNSFINNPIANDAFKVLSNENTATIIAEPIPTKIGRFELINLIGKGGMGEVFLARDESLERDVAVKILPSDFTADSSRVSRFIREAKAASALNHPNILTIYEIGEFDGTNFMAAEFVNGKTLNNYQQTEKKSLQKILKVSIQIASALQAAHEAGIVHRDIKPDNIMVRHDGIVKILDFGLAKLLENETQQLKIKDKNSTAFGLIMGTPQFMSPEQARGKKVDSRTDIFSFGVVLYQMLADKLPFSGETTSDIIAAILTKEAKPLPELNSEIPPELNKIVEKCLQKDAQNRYQTAKQLVQDLEEAKENLQLQNRLEKSFVPNLDEEKTRVLQVVTAEELQQTHTQKITPKSYKSYILIGLAGFLIIASGYFGYQFFKPKSRFNSLYNKTTVERIPIKTQGYIVASTLTPDGKYLAFLERGKNTGTRLVLRHLATSTDREVVSMGFARLAHIQFSPDSDFLYYSKDGGTGGLTIDIYKVPLIGGESVKVVAKGSEFSFSSDGKRMVFSRNVRESFIKYELVILDLETKTEKVIYSTNDARDSRLVSQPAFSPNGQYIAFAEQVVNEKWRLKWISVESGEPKDLVNSDFEVLTDILWLKDDSGLITSGQFNNQPGKQLVKISFPNGQIIPITNDLNFYLPQSLSADDKSVTVVQKKRSTGIWELDLATKEAKQIIQDNEDNKLLRNITPDNKMIYSKSDAKGALGLWSAKLDGSNERFLADVNVDYAPAAAMNDGTIYYIDGVHGDIWRMNEDGSGKTQITNLKNIMAPFIIPSNDEKFILYSPTDAKSLNKIDLETKQITELLKLGEDNIVVVGLRDDNKKILYRVINNESGKGEFKTYLADFDGENISNPQLLFEKLVNNLMFSADYKSLYFLNNDENDSANVWQIDIATKKITKITNFDYDRLQTFRATRDKQRLFLSRIKDSSEILLIKNAE
jgi:eukaryotic-like serine/threonine-protein kinase